MSELKVFKKTFVCIKATNIDGTEKSDGIERVGFVLTPYPFQYLKDIIGIHLVFDHPDQDAQSKGLQFNFRTSEIEAIKMLHVNNGHTNDTFEIITANTIYTVKIVYNG
jgi:hypothetical protein